MSSSAVELIGTGGENAQYEIDLSVAGSLSFNFECKFGNTCADGTSSGKTGAITATICASADGVITPATFTDPDFTIKAGESGTKTIPAALSDFTTSLNHPTGCASIVSINYESSGSTGTTGTAGAPGTV